MKKVIKVSTLISQHSEGCMVAHGVNFETEAMDSIKINIDSEGVLTPIENAMKYGTSVWLMEDKGILSVHATCPLAGTQGTDCIANPSFNFGRAIEYLRLGKSVARQGWNGKGIFIKLQVPDAHSFMTTEYMYIDTTQLDTDNSAAPKVRVPWLASQTDMLADDWQLAN